jgi:hypothetical protein
MFDDRSTLGQLSEHRLLREVVASLSLLPMKKPFPLVKAFEREAARSTRSVIWISIAVLQAKRHYSQKVLFVNH